MRKRDCKIGRTGDMVMEAKVLLIADLLVVHIQSAWTKEDRCLKVSEHLG
jgi:hypothetical protein